MSYSQGDQPDVVSVERSGKKIELRMLDKNCAGSCDNFMILSSGGGENEESTFFRIERLVFDEDKQELVIEGETKSFVAPSEPRTVRFQKCDLTATTRETVERQGRAPRVAAELLGEWLGVRDALGQERT